LINGNPDDGEMLAIGDCSGPGWRLDGNGLLPSEADDNPCMHACKPIVDETGKRQKSLFVV
jgi:hypothetical protein